MAKAKPAAEKPASKSAAIRALLADGIDKSADVIAEAKKRWKLAVTKGDFYNVKSATKAKKKAKLKAKPKAKARAKPKAAKGGSTQDAVKALKGVVDHQGIEKTRELLDIMEALQG